MDDQENVIKNLNKSLEKDLSLDGFTEQEVLCALLSYVKGCKQNSLELAGKVLEKFGSLERFFAADYKQLVDFGFSEDAADELLFSAAFIKKAALEKFKFPFKYSEALMKEYLLTLFKCCGNEKMYLMPVKRGRVTGSYLISEGDPESVKLDHEKMIPLLEKSDGYILAHNHPNASCKPSEADKSAAKYIAIKLKKLGFEHICHYTVGIDGIDVVLGRPNYLALLMDGSMD